MVSDVNIGMKLSISMARVPAGKFLMGSPEDEEGREEDEKQHKEIIPGEFEIMTTPVTQAMWETVMECNLSDENRGPDLPVVLVSWYDAVAFCNALSRSAGLEEVYHLEDVHGQPGVHPENLPDGVEPFIANVETDFRKDGFRLPTEAEWEYSCRAGSTDAQYGDLDEIAWYRNNMGKLQFVGLKKPNAWGLYDMLGNVVELTNDDYRVENDVESMCTGDNKVKFRAGRGGCFANSKSYIRAAKRFCVASLN